MIFLQFLNHNDFVKMLRPPDKVLDNTENLLSGFYDAHTLVFVLGIAVTISRCRGLGLAIHN